MHESTDPLCLPDARMAALLAPAPWRRFVVAGDSVAEGLGDPRDGYRDRPWADRLIDALAATRPLESRNLGRRGLLAAEVRERQLDAALALEPDVVLLAAGGNDALGRAFDGEAVEGQLDAMVGALRAAGADVLTVGLFDITRAPVLPEPLRGPLGGRLRELAARTRTVALRHGAVHLDFSCHPAAFDAGIYSADGRHLNARGHAIAAAGAARRIAEWLSYRPAGRVPART